MTLLQNDIEEFIKDTCYRRYGYTKYKDAVIVWDEDQDSRIFELFTLTKAKIRLAYEHEGHLMLITSGGPLRQLHSGMLDIAGDSWSVDQYFSPLLVDDIIPVLEKIGLSEVDVRRPLSSNQLFRLKKMGYSNEDLEKISFDEGLVLIGDFFKSQAQK